MLSCSDMCDRVFFGLWLGQGNIAALVTTAPIQTRHMHLQHHVVAVLISTEIAGSDAGSIRAVINAVVPESDLRRQGEVCENR